MVRTYSPKDVSVIVDGNIIEVFQSVTIDYDEDRISHEPSATGESTRVINANNLGTITIDVPNTSIDNAKLLDVYNDILSNYGSGKFASVRVIDKMGNSKHTMAQGSVTKVPSTAYEKNKSDYTWVIAGDIDNHEPRGNR